jgi:deoxyribodipyrimidine photo-lyase
MIAERSGKDWTAQFNPFAAKRVQALTALDLAGYIFKKNSPSCGMERVRVYNSKGVPTRQGRGLFAAAVMEASRRLKEFLRSRLGGYATRRNKPDLDGTSQLSPYLHFGHMGPHTIALAVQDAGAPLQDRAAFLEELIVRRELAVNFVRYNSNYENFDSCEAWADVTLRKHAPDKRRFVYTARDLENAETHDPLWNAAQKQMVLTGWMHGYLRMYWAKKILEWSPSPGVAYDTAVQLNDRYELDGRDPNGYAGIAWAVAGKHDRAWGPERSVYGKIRYMSYESTSRKFNSKAYVERISALERNRSSAS